MEFYRYRLKLNLHLIRKLKELNNKKSRGQDKTMVERLDEEKAKMKPLPISQYDTALVQSLKMDKYHTISVDHQPLLYSGINTWPKSQCKNISLTH